MQKDNFSDNFYHHRPKAILKYCQVFFLKVLQGVLKEGMDILTIWNFIC